MLPLRVRVLGGLDVEGVEQASLGSRTQRRLLARLVLAGGAVVSADALAEDLWGDVQPVNPRDDLSVLVSRLRSTLPGGELTRRDGGYALAVTWTDLAEVSRLREVAAAHAARERWPAAAEAARAALALVRGPVLPELAEAPWVTAEQASVDTSSQQARLVLARAEHAVGDPRVAGALGVDPSPDTVAVYESLLEATRPAAPSAPPRQQPPDRASRSSPVTERQHDHRPETQYVRTADGVYIAYQVTGSGPIDVLFNVGLLSHVEAAWDIPGKAQFFRRLGSFCRLIRFDKRGSGLSDPVVGPTTLEERTEDMRAVLDAVGSKRTALLGISEGGSMSILFAALYPERTSTLVLFGTAARGSRAADYPYGLDIAAAQEALEQAVAVWGTQDDLVLHLLAPSVVGDEQLRQSFIRYERLAASPGQFAATTRMNLELDVRAILPTVQTPTLVLHREQELFFEVGHGQYLAENIPGATLTVLPGADHMYWVDPDQILDEIEDFLIGARRTREPDRVLSTILITDIVGSTERASSMGDAAWRELLDRHDRLVRHQLQQFGGRELNTAGDSFVASFDGPARAVRCAQSIVAHVRAAGLQVRAGVHTGECEVRDANLAGIAMHIAARVGALAAPDEVLVSSTVRDLVAGSGLRFVSRGEHRLKGIEEPWRVFAVDPV
jgi:class 3 adenylate cyclase